MLSIRSQVLFVQGLRRVPTLRAVLVAGVALTAALPTLSHAQGAGQSAQAADRLDKPDLSKLPKTPVVPTTFEGLFAERDSRARDALQYLTCLQSTINALRSGALGRVPTYWSIACMKQGAEWRAIFGELTDSGMVVQLQYAMRGGRGVITRDAVDTARANGTARAVLRGLSAPAPGGGQYPIVPIALAQNKFVEVWFVSASDDPSRAIVGGDSLIQMSADGKRELGHIQKAPPIRTLIVPATGTSWEVPSLEERIPSVSELMAARKALTYVTEVRVRTKQYDSVLRRGATSWTHTRR